MDIYIHTHMGAPTAEAPEARKAAFESVVPAQTTQPGRKPHRASAWDEGEVVVVMLEFAL